MAYYDTIGNEAAIIEETRFAQAEWDDWGSWGTCFFYLQRYVCLPLLGSPVLAALTFGCFNIGVAYGLGQICTWLAVDD
jgi:hypothetical protein